MERHWSGKSVLCLSVLLGRQFIVWEWRVDLQVFNISMLKWERRIGHIEITSGTINIQPRVYRDRNVTMNANLNIKHVKRWIDHTLVTFI